MSADNYIYVYQCRSGFDCRMQFMSMDYDEARQPAQGRFATAAEAVGYAHDWEARETIVEYGIVLAPEVVDALAAGGAR